MQRRVQGRNLILLKTKTMNTLETLSQVMNMLKTERGYTEDFNLLDEHLELKAQNERFSHDEFIVDEVFRFEGFSNPSDSSVLYAITTSTDRKGVLVDAHGLYGGQISDEMLKKLDLKKHRPQ